jgi:predicted DNA-binding transcriptional regulator AlpA
MRPKASKDDRKPALRDEDGFVRLGRILELIPVSESTWHRGIRSGRFPAPVRLGVRTRAWRIADIRALLAEFAGTGESQTR